MTDIQALTAATVQTEIENLVVLARQTTPLVHCITNTVVQGITANALLAAGQAPAMVDNEGEAAQFAAIASALLINVGTIAPHQVVAMPLAAAAANAAGVPWVLDPVAVGYLTTRTELARELVQLRPTAIRGNASEIAALAGLGAGGRGVDTTDSVAAVVPAALQLAQTSGAVVAVSGPRDVIVWNDAHGEHTLWLDSGHELMPRVIGTGCALGALIAGYLGALRGDRGSLPAAEIAKQELALAVTAAHAHTGAAGIFAGTKASAPGSFGGFWLDALSDLSAADIAKAVTVTV